MTATVPAPLRLVLTTGRRFELSVVGVGLACCAVELLAASLDGGDVLRLSASDEAGPTTESVLVVSCTVTTKVAPAVRAMYDALPEPRHVISFGSCANTGGPYWDSYAVVQGVGQLLPVDLQVPGCPPRPEALLDALVQLQRA